MSLEQETVRRDAPQAYRDVPAMSPRENGQRLRQADVERRHMAAEQEDRLNAAALYTLLGVMGIALIGLLAWHFGKPTTVAQAPVLNMMPSPFHPGPASLTAPASPATSSSSVTVYPAAPAAAAPMNAASPAPTPTPAPASPVTATPPAAAPSAPTQVTPTVQEQPAPDPAGTASNTTPPTNAPDATTPANHL